MAIEHGVREMFLEERHEGGMHAYRRCSPTSVVRVRRAFMSQSTGSEARFVRRWLLLRLTCGG
jgi:hypothetical protein